MTKYYTTSKLSENIQETPEGFLVCLSVPIGRTGDMIYGKHETPLEADAEGKVIVHRMAEELFHPDTIASFEGKPFTIGHPEDFVGPDNWSDLARGFIQNVRKSDEKDEDGYESLLADIMVTDKIAIGMIKAGIREVSCGYEANYEQVGPGKGRQTGIIGNHLALVSQGRAGPSYAINDHKMEKSTMSKLAEKLKLMFGKVVDEAVMEEEKAKDAEAAPEKKEHSYDEIMGMVKDLSEKVASLMEKKEEKSSDESMEKKDDAPAADAEVAPALEDRLKALEMMVEKLIQHEAEEGEMMGDEETLKEEKKTGDQKLTGLEETKLANRFGTSDSQKGFMTAEALNAKNKAFWSQK